MTWSVHYSSIAYAVIFLQHATPYISIAALAVVFKMMRLGEFVQTMTASSKNVSTRTFQLWIEFSHT